MVGLRTADNQDEQRRGKTAVPLKQLRELGKKLSEVPADFKAHRTIQRFMDNRAKMIESGEGIDWAMAEALAFGSLVQEGTKIRLSGQDVERGTFSQRHSVLYDQETEERYIPLANVAPNQARYEVINSMLSEEAVLGFEYGYSLARPNALTLWEAQFGDFANGAQVLFDQFISSGERKWLACRASSACCRTATRARVRNTPRPGSSASCRCARKTTCRSPTAPRLPTISTFCAGR
jgi:2-oxoglutarate dehydrogenase E1 component